MNQDQQRANFDAWYDTYDPRTPQSPFDKNLAWKAWQAALGSPEVQALRKDSQLLSAIESDEGADIIRLSSNEWEVSGYAKDLYGTGRTLREAIDNAIKEAEMKKLFSDLKNDEEKSAFFLSGRGYETGVIAQSIQNDVAMAYHRCAEYEKEIQALQEALRNLYQAIDSCVELTPKVMRQAQAALAAMEKQQ